MRYVALVLASSFLVLAARQGRADIGSDFATNPLTDPGNQLSGPDAATRFTYDGGAQTLTAHYDSTLPTVKLLFPLGQTFTQNTSFHVSSTFKILSAGFTPSEFFSAEAPSFGLVNSTSTGDMRASTADSSFNIVTQGTAYDVLGFDYFPTQDAGSSSIDLTAIQSPEAGQAFDDRFIFNNSLFSNAALATDQSITVTIDYDAATEHAAVNWGSGSLDADLSGAVFNLDSFALTLWNDPQYAPTDGSFAWDAGQAVSGDVAFSGFSVEAVPEPGSLALLIPVAMLLIKRRRIVWR